MISGEMFGGPVAPTVAGVRLYSLKWASDWVYNYNTKNEQSVSWDESRSKHFRDNLASQSLDLCKTPFSLLNQSLD